MKDLDMVGNHIFKEIFEHIFNDVKVDCTFTTIFNIKTRAVQLSTTSQQLFQMLIMRFYVLFACLIEIGSYR